jgi:transposase
MQSCPEIAKKPKYMGIDRSQLLGAPLDVEKLIPADHRARAIWELVGRLDLSAWEQDVKSVEGEAGRSRWPPRLLIRVLVYAYAEGVSSVREIERMMEQEPGMRWL